MRNLADVPAAFPPDRLAIVHGEAPWTWGNLDRRASQWCRWLAEWGVGADDPVAFALPNGTDFIALEGLNHWYHGEVQRGRRARADR